MKERLVITLIWLVAFILSILIVESYVHTQTSDGLQILFAEDRLLCMKPLMVLFSSYLAGILSFWFLKPFKPTRIDATQTIRFWLATSCTLVFVLVVLYFVSYVHIFGVHEGGVLSDINTGVSIAKMMSFIVAPINIYYFGLTPSGPPGST